jgi:DNA-binding MarR family transcriptional regulator
MSESQAPPETPTEAAPGHPAVQLDDVVHQRVRLGILCVLGEIDRAEFTYLRQLLELSDGNLARHLSVLVDAGHVAITKERPRSRTRTWVAITPVGKRALRDEIESLERIIGTHRQLPREDLPCD